MKNNNSPYLLGLLCLIPLIGAFIGFGLIFYGIFKYKDKKLVIIGLIGLFLTVIVYSSVFYNLKFGKGAANSFAKISQMELNSLVKSIEFYKLQKGIYPDSLEQLREGDKLILIYDPLLTRKMDNNLKTTFEYKHLGNKYILSSVGIDGIPNTTDDLYPTIFEKDSSSFGLIKK